MSSVVADLLYMADSLRLSPSELEVLPRYANQLSQQAGTLTEQFWEWLLGDSQTASYVKNIATTGKDRLKVAISDHYRSLLTSDYDARRADALITLGRYPEKMGLTGQWISDSYKAFAELLDQAVNHIPTEDRTVLRSALHKRLRFDEGCVQVGYRYAQQESLHIREGLYEAIRFSNQLLANHSNPVMLLDGVVKTLAHHLKTPLLVIAYVNPRTQRVHIRAAAGPAKAYLNDLPISASSAFPEGRGPAGRALASGKVVQVDRFIDDPEFALWLPRATRYGLSGSITAPFRTRRGVQGYVSMYRTQEKHFPAGASGLLERLAADIGVALDRIHTQRELRRLRTYEEALDVINQALLKNPPPKAIYRLLVDTIVRQTGAPLAYVNLIDSQTGAATVVCSAGKGAKTLQVLELSVNTAELSDTGITGKVYHSGKEIVVADALSCPEFAPWKELMSLHRLRGVAAFPIGEQGKKPDAVLFVASRQGTYFTRQIIKLLSQLATNASLAISNYYQRQRLEHLSVHDPLTGLPNRTYFERAITEALGRSNRDKRPLAIGILDLDGFKEVNDTLGHPAGDNLLRSVSDRLLKVMRQGDVVARIGGDEFGLLLSMEEGGDVGSAAVRILDVLDEPISWNGHNVIVKARMGFTVYPMDSSDRETLQRHADAVLYVAKKNHTRVEVFQSSVARQVEQRYRVRQTFPNDIKEGKIHFFLQPQANMRLGQLEGLEMLARASDGEQWLNPETFIPVVEQDPALIRLLGELAIREAILLNQRLVKHGLNLRISVNIGVRHLLHPSFIQNLDAALADCRDPSFLTLEITEAAALADLSLTISRLKAIRSRSLWSSLDDFGTGYTSLLYAASLPVSELKLGQEFIRGLQYKAAHAAVAISTLEHAGLSSTRVIAEGVETQEQLAYWLRLGGQRIQGHLLAPPMEEHIFIAWAKNLKLIPQSLPPPYPRDDLPVLAQQAAVKESLVRLRAAQSDGAEDPSMFDAPDMDRFQTAHWLEHRKSLYGHLPEFPFMNSMHYPQPELTGTSPRQETIALLESWDTGIKSLVGALDHEIACDPDKSYEQAGEKIFYL